MKKNPTWLRLLPVFTFPVLALILIFWAFSQPTLLRAQESDVRYVAPPPWGSDSGNTCASPYQPCATVGQAVSQASSGDEIRIAAGSYVETVRLDRHLTVHGGYAVTEIAPTWVDPDPAANPTIIDASTGLSGTQRALHVSAGVSATVRGLNLTGGKAEGGHGAGVYNEGTLTLADCAVYDNHVSFGNGGGIANATGADLTLHDCQVYDNSSSEWGGGMSLNGTALVEASEVYSNSAQSVGGGFVILGAEVTVQSCLVYANNTPSSGGGMAIDATAVRIHNNTFFDNQAGGGSGGALFAYSGTVTLFNNLIVENVASSSGGVHSLATLTSGYNGFYNNTPDDGETSGTDNRTAIDPLFVDSANYDLHIQAGSYARDSGTGVSPNTAVDYEGQGRPFGLLLDRGGDEYISTGECYARIKGGRVYTNVQQAVDACELAACEVVQVAGTCTGSDAQMVIDSDLALRGGYTLTDWTQPIYGPTVLDGDGGRVIEISSSPITVLLDKLWVTGGAATNGAGVSVGNGATLFAQNCLLVDNAATSGGGLFLATGAQAVLRFDTLYDNSATGSGGAIYASAGSTLTVNSTILAGNQAALGGGLYAVAGAALTTGYNAFDSNSGGHFGGSASASSSDLFKSPGFVNAAGLDLHLDVDSSELIEAADPDGVRYDADHHNRPLGRGADIGAYESALYADVFLTESPDNPRIISDVTEIEDTYLYFTHTVTNMGRLPTVTDTVDLSWANSAGWDTMLLDDQGAPAATTIVLTQGQSLGFSLLVSVPTGTVFPFYNQTWLTATSQNHAASFDQVRDVIATPRILLSPTYDENADPGEVLTYVHTLKNEGPIEDVFQITIDTPLSWGTPVSVSDYITVAPGATELITIRVEVPSTAPAGLEELIEVTAYSSEFSGVSASVVDRTVANPTTGDRYVAPVSFGGSDVNNNCTEPTMPCAGIGHAATQAAWGDTIRVAAGTYQDRDIIINQAVNLLGGFSYSGGNYDPPIETETGLHRVDPSLTIIDAQGLGRLLRIQLPPGTEVTVQGFTLRNGASSGLGGAVYIQATSSPNLTDLVIENSVAAKGGGIYIDDGDPVLQGVVLSSTVASASGGGIYVDTGSPTLSACRIGHAQAPSGGGLYNDAGTVYVVNSFVFSSTASEGSGGGFYNDGTLTMINATLYGNEAATLGGALYTSASSDIVIFNTIVASNTANAGGGLYAGTAGILDADYNNFYGNAASLYVDSNVPTGTNSIAVDPLFMNVVNEDFRLSFDSFCVDAGDPDSTLIEDFERDLRPTNQGYDLGADEVSGCLARVMTPDLGAQIGPVYGVLQKAIDAAPPDYVIQVTGICRGVNNRLGLSQTVVITKGLQIMGGYRNDFAIFDPETYPTMLFAQWLGRTAVVTDLVAGENVILTHLILSGGDADGLGGGPGGADAGGGLYLSGQDGQLVLESVTISQSFAHYGGGIYAAPGVGEGFSTGPSLVLTMALDINYPDLKRPTWLVENHAIYGGGLYNLGQTHIERCIVISNTANVSGGGIFNASDNGLMPTDAPIELTVINTRIMSNTAGNGGGIFNQAVTMTVRHVTMYGNEAIEFDSSTGYGGGLFFAAPDATLIPTDTVEAILNSSLIINNAAKEGGGVYVYGGLPPEYMLDMNYNDVFGNSGGDYGGMMGASDGTGNISSDPNFISTDPASDDLLEIPGGSPAEDSGDPLSPVTDDPEDDPRPSNQAPDIGADEVGGCYAHNARTLAVYGSVQRAATTALDGDLIQVAGTCRGVSPASVGRLPTEIVSQTLFLTRSLTIKGGYTQLDWSIPPNPEIYPTTLDAIGLGRVVYITRSAQVVLSHLTLQNGRAAPGGGPDQGGAIWLGSGTLNLTETLVYSSSAVYGGGIYIDGQGFPTKTVQIIIDGNTRVMSHTAQYGGALYVAGGEAVVHDTALANNQATEGGAVFHAGGQLTMTNNVLYENTATLGGAVYHGLLQAQSTLTTTLWHNTFFSNTANMGAGFYAPDGPPIGKVSIYNNIFATNTVTNTAHAVYGPVSLVVDYNDAYPPTNAFGGSFVPGTNNLTLDPLFEDIHSHDVHLRGESPVRNRGVPTMTLLVDWEGDMRPGHQGFDIGADEVPSCRARIVREPDMVYGNLQRAIDHSLPGDVIQITSDYVCGDVHGFETMTGTVLQTIHITHPLTLIGGYNAQFLLSNANTILDPAAFEDMGRAVWISTTGEVMLTGLTLQNGSALGLGGGPGEMDAGGGMYVALPATDTVSVILTRTNFFSNAAVYGGGLYNASTMMLDDFVHFENNAADDAGGAIYNTGVLTVWNSLFYSNLSQGQGGALWFDDHGQTTVAHDVFYANWAANEGGAIYADRLPTEAVIENTIFDSNIATDGGAIYGSVVLTVDYNDYYANSGFDPVAGGVLTGANSLDYYPYFIDPDTRNFHLDEWSLLIDAGNPASIDPDHDIDEDPRPINNAPDIGLDEYNECLVRNARTLVVYGRIQTAIDEANTGDELDIAFGTCYEAFRINKDITISGNWYKDFSGYEQDVLQHYIKTYVDASEANTRTVTIDGQQNQVTATLTWIGFRNGNAGTEDGGGIWNTADRLVLNKVNIFDSLARDGGAFWSQDSVVSAIWLWFEGNEASRNGGAAYLNGGDIDFTMADIEENQAGNNGGGIYSSDDTRLHITGGGPIEDNIASGDGGGLYSDGSRLSIINKSFKENQAQNGAGILLGGSGGYAELTNLRFFANEAASNGGGLYRSTDDRFSLLHSTVYSNTAVNGSGGGLFNLGNTMPITASIVASNTSNSGGTGIEGDSRVDYTLIWGNTTNGTAIGGGCLFQDPVFLPNSGGGFLLYTSPAIDAVPESITGVDIDAALDPRPHICDKDMGRDEYGVGVRGLNFLGTPSPASAVLTPTQTVTFTYSMRNDSENYLDLWEEWSSRGPGTGYTETVTVTLENDYPAWTRIAGLEATNGLVQPGQRSATFDLGPGETAWISVTVTVPPGTYADKTDNVFLRTLYSWPCPGTELDTTSDLANVTVKENRDFEIAPDNTGSALPGTTVTYTHFLTNIGNITDTYTIYPKAGYYALGQIAEPVSTTFELPPGMTKTLVLSVSINPEAAGGLVDVTGLIAQSGSGREKAVANNTWISYTTGSRYVSLDGQDSLVDETVGNPDPDAVDYADNNCTQPDVGACRTIQQALDQAASGDWIKIEGGTYSEILTATYESAVVSQIAFVSKPVTITGGYDKTDWTQYPPDHITHTTILDAQGAGRVFLITPDATSVTLDRLVVQGGTGDQGGNILFHGTALTLTAVRLTDGTATQGGAVYVGLGQTQATSLWMQNNLVHDNQAVDGGAIYADLGPAQATLIHNTFYNNQATGEGAGLYLLDGQARITNTIWATQSGGVAIYANPLSATVTAGSNLYHGNAYGDTGGAAPAPGPGDVLADPAFIDPASRDLHLMPGSPALDVGMMLIDIDYDNDLRPLNAVPDIGADERVPVQDLRFYPNTVTSAQANMLVVITHTLDNESDVPDTVPLSAASSQNWGFVVEPPLGTPIPMGTSEQRTVTISYTIPMTANGMSVVTLITATSSTNPNVTALVRDEIRIESAAWSIAKTVLPDDTVQPGGTLTYTLVARNVGDIATSGIYTISDRLPEYTHLLDTSPPATLAGDVVLWTLSDPVPAGGAVTVTLRVTVTKPLTDGTPIVNATYSVEGGTTPAPATGAPVTIDAQAYADLTISKVAAGGGLPSTPIHPGEWMTYTITVGNQSSAASAALNVIITDTLPPEVVFQDAGVVAPALGAVTRNGQDIEWTLSTPVQPGETAQVTVTVRVTSPLDTGGACSTALLNTFGARADNALVDAGGWITTPIEVENTILIGKRVEPQGVPQSGTVTYTIQVTNTGTGIATVTLEDQLDPAFSPDTFNTVVTVPGRGWSTSGGVVEVPFVVTAPGTGGIYTNPWLTATVQACPSSQVTLHDSAPLRVQQPIDNLALVNDSPTMWGQSTVLTASMDAGLDVTYTLDFGDGSPLQTGDLLSGVPVVTSYVYPVGTYTAILTAQNAASMQVVTTLVIVQEGVDGLMAFNDSPTELGSLTTLSTTVTAGTDLVYSWAYGDGTDDPGLGTPDTSHTYSTVGSYTAVVTVENSVSAMTATTVVTITDVPITGLEAFNDSPTLLGTGTTLSTTVTTGSNVIYDWDYGDGTSALGLLSGNTLHTYSAGVYTAAVTATNSVNLMTAKTVITVIEGVSDLALDSDSPTLLGTDTTLTITIGGGTDVSYLLDYGDGTTDDLGLIATPVVVTYTYAAPGSYTAVVTATNSVSQMTATATIEVQEAITGLLAFNDSPTALSSATMLSATVSAGTHIVYDWDYGDGASDLGLVSPVSSHTYPAVGTYTTVVTASNAFSSFTTTTMVTVEETIADLALSSDAPTLLTTLTTFTATMDAGSGVSYTLDLGDGSPLLVGTLLTGTPLVLSHSYLNPGTYTVVLTASNSVSLMTATATVVVQEGVDGLMAFNNSPTKLGSLTTLSATVTAGTDLVYDWSYGEGTVVSDLGTSISSYTYPAVMTYTAVITARNDVSSMSAATVVTITDVPITDLEAFNDSPTLLGTATTLSTTITTGSNVVYDWDHGDGTSALGLGTESTLHTYPAPGVYTAVVTATNSVNQMTATTVITVQEGVSDLSLDNDSPTLLSTRTTLTITLGGGTDVIYDLAFGDGFALHGLHTQVITHAYPAPGVYTATVTAYNDVSQMTATTQVTVVQAIWGLLAFNDSPTPLGYATTLSATVDEGTHIVYSWDYGDGTSDLGLATPVISHTYSAIGIYEAVVTAENAFSSFTATTWVTITQPTVDLAAAYAADEASGAATITVTLSASTTIPVYVNFQTTDGTAAAGMDYVAAFGSLEFLPGQVSKTFLVTILDETLYEADETVLLSLSDPIDAVPGNMAAVLTIRNDDALPTIGFAQAEYTAGEQDGAATITVALSNPSVETVQVNYATQDGSATADADYVTTNGTLVFSPGEVVKTFEVSILDDPDTEAITETVVLTLSQVVSGLLERPAEALLNIIDDESLTPTYFIYIPTIFQDEPHFVNRDLIVEDVWVESQNPFVVMVRVRNVGTTDIPYDFWVDLYLDPNPVPQRPGDMWDPPRCFYGGAWLVTGGVAAQDQVILSTANFNPSYSRWPTTPPQGLHVLYAQVDSYGGTQGMVIEDDENNNIHGPVPFSIQ